MKRKIAVILAADIAGYSRLIAEDEEETLRRFETYRTVFAEFVERGGGRIFNTAGDAILAEFESAVEAVRAAVDVQESLRARNLAYPPSRHMNFRIGITIGDVVERENGDLLGDGVNVAARLESVAPPGGVCISRSVHEAVASKMDLTFADAGPQTLKNIPERIHAYTLALDEPPSAHGQGDDADGEITPASSARAPADRNSRLVTAGLAVLGLAVVGAYAYEYTPRSVLEGVGLVATEPEANEGPSPATTQVAAAEEPEPDTPTEPATPSPAPARTEEQATSIERNVEDAIATLDGNAGPTRTPPTPLASRYVLTRQWKDCQESTDADVALNACKGLIDTAGFTPDDQAIIHYKYARALRDKGEPAQAIEHYRRSIELKPAADTYQHRAIAHYDQGDYLEAVADFDEALKLKPQSAEALNNRAWTYYKAGDADRALEDANRAIQFDGSKAYIWDTRAHILEELGKTPEAIRDYRKALQLDAGYTSSRDGLRRLGAPP
ncbi:addiction module protein [Hyphomicrobium nitrativorans NL23]|uniref:Addiction module protein n=1 Tax=Hyphomicrobium nitrativorans NL23 TaxID=1029756 RepID=V5SDJ6_9HYPH|nr:tetratricopeptide repeat protein [Hyphomicrobium nitrativorans]AHB48941.1 addiction module protein [Hyphomicrobium nitrativorans NL23]